MTQSRQWAFPEALQPKAAETQFDLVRALDAVVLVRAEIPEDAFTADVLGTERSGYGVVIAETGLVLTIGYLITEATQVWLTTNRGAVVGGYPLAYDQATGFGLIHPLGKLDAPYLSRGLASDVKVGDSAFVIGHGGLAHALKTRLVDKREFAGYWEYVLDEAIFTAPAHPQWGGAALLDAQGDLVGIGSLLVEEEVEGKSIHVNMFVPIDLLNPILDSMLKTGRSPHPPRPWLGLYTQEQQGRMVVGFVVPEGPADRAGLRQGDIVVGVGSEEVGSLADFYRKVWARGAAGVEIPVRVLHGTQVREVSVRSIDRQEYFRQKTTY